jgi:hypothetical protein
VLGLSGRDGGSDDRLIALNVEVADEGIEFAAGFEAAAAARAITAWSVQSMILGRTRRVVLTCRATALPRLGGRHGSHVRLMYRVIWEN